MSVRVHPAPPPPPLVPAAGRGSIGGAEPYRIQAGDVLDVRLLLNPDLNQDVVVADGHMSTTVVRTNAPLAAPSWRRLMSLSHDYTSIIRNPSPRRGHLFAVELWRRRDGWIELTVWDDGPGFDAGSVIANPDGLGLSIMQGLAAELGGALNLESHSGTTVTVEFPLRQSD